MELSWPKICSQLTAYCFDSEILVAKICDNVFVRYMLSPCSIERIL